jgi:hypothetical protein
MTLHAIKNLDFFSCCKSAANIATLFFQVKGKRRDPARLHDLSLLSNDKDLVSSSTAAVPSGSWINNRRTRLAPALRGPSDVIRLTPLQRPNAHRAGEHQPNALGKVHVLAVVSP